MTWLLMLLLAVSPDDDLRSKDAFRRAQTLYTQGRFLDAIRTFEESRRLNPRPAVQYNLGRCYEELNETGRALYHYREYVRTAPTAADRAAVDTKIAALAKKLAAKKLQVLVVSAVPEDASVSIDGQRMGNGQVELEVTLGAHDVQVGLSGFETQNRTVTVTADAQVITEFELLKLKPPATPIAEAPMVPADAPKTPADAPVKDKSEPAKVSIVQPVKEEKPFLVKHGPSTVAAAVAIVGTGVGIGFGVSSSAATAELRGDVHAREYADGLVKKATDSATGANVAYAVAGAALITAVVLFFVESGDGSK